MKTDPMIAYQLGNVPTFLPKIGFSDVLNKMGEKYKEKYKEMKGIISDNTPTKFSLWDPAIDYDTYDVVGSTTDDNSNSFKESWRVPYNTITTEQ